jgi:hypothetical protein
MSLQIAFDCPVKLKIQERSLCVHKRQLTPRQKMGTYNACYVSLGEREPSISKGTSKYVHHKSEPLRSQKSKSVQVQSRRVDQVKIHRPDIPKLSSKAVQVL